MIWNFQDKETEKIFERKFSKKFPPQLQRQMLKKLMMLHRSQSLNDLKVPPSNHLKKLKGKKRNLYSIRVNDQWRICFEWLYESPVNVEITDYH